VLDEPVVRAEGERLAKELGARGVAVVGEVLNRTSPAASALPVTTAPVHFLAPTVDPPPTGVAAIRRWSHAWRSVLTRDK
jgi:hypothetical protein